MDLRYKVVGFLVILLLVFVVIVYSGFINIRGFLGGGSSENLNLPTENENIPSENVPSENKPSPQEEEMVLVEDFGSNPGDLKMYKHVPDGEPTGSPLVVVLHGCDQTAQYIADLSGYNEMADEYGFYVVYPQQRLTNNMARCFNWFSGADLERREGEPASIKKMVDYMKSNHEIDSDRIYVAGLSAGGYMSAILMATYPDVFDAGAIIAGGPYKAATNLQEGMSVTGSCPDRSPKEWGEIVRNAYPGYEGDYPELSIWHGTEDYTVDNSNAREAVEQWTNVNGADSVPDLNESFRGHVRVVYKDQSESPVVEMWRMLGMPHGLPVDPGENEDQGGSVGAYSYDSDVYFAYYSARFWGMIEEGS